MYENVESLVLERLRAIRTKLDGMGARLGEPTVRVGSLASHFVDLRGESALLHGDTGNIHQRLDRQELRLDRIERGLDLAGT